MRRNALLALTALLAAAPVFAAERPQSLVLTSSNTTNNTLIVLDTTGNVVDEVPTQGQGGVGSNAGGLASNGALVAVVNFGSQDVSLFARSEGRFVLQQLVPATSQPVSVAFGKDHLYVLGTTTVESHRMVGTDVDAGADGITTLTRADGTAAQVGVVGDELLVTEKSGVIERIPLQGGRVSGTPDALDLPAALGNTPFGFATRGDTAYVTVAGSDLVAVIKDAGLTGYAATGTPGGDGQHSPCWIVAVGPYLFTTNSPSHSVSRLVAGGQTVVLDDPVAAQTGGAPIDIDSDGAVVAVLESNGGGVSHLSQFRLGLAGSLDLIVSTPLASPANGVVIVAAN